MFHNAKAGDPVFRGVSDRVEKLRRTGSSAFAEYDSVARSDLSAGAQRAKAEATKLQKKDVRSTDKPENNRGQFRLVTTEAGDHSVEH